MTTGLLSIREPYASRIFGGTKDFEFRRRAPDLEVPTTFLVYVAGKPRQLRGEIVVDEVLAGSPSAIWEQTKHAAGIPRREFRRYFSGRDKAYAWRIADRTEYARQPELDALRSTVPGGFHPPQYLRWLTGSQVSSLRSLACVV